MNLFFKLMKLVFNTPKNSRLFHRFCGFKHIKISKTLSLREKSLSLWGKKSFYFHRGKLEIPLSSAKINEKRLPTYALQGLVWIPYKKKPEWGLFCTDLFNLHRDVDDFAARREGVFE